MDTMNTMDMIEEVENPNYKLFVGSLDANTSPTGRVLLRF